MSNLSKILLAQADYFRSTDNYIMKEAIDISIDDPSASEEILEVAASACNDMAEYLEKSADAISESEAPDGELTLNRLEEIAVLASEFDKSDDPLLKKQASVLDEILLTIGAPSNAYSNAKRAQDDEIDKIRNKIREKERDPYKFVKEEHDKQNDVEKIKSAIKNVVKQYRPQEAALSTRTCPDHPGAQIMRVGEDTYQCELDKGIYNYVAGFTTMKGNKVPGADVSGQTSSLFDRSNEVTSFDTRESKLNS